MNNSTNQKPLGMGWYSFLVKFGLYAGAVRGIYNGLLFISGMVYYSTTNGEFTAQQVYAYNGIGLKVVDIIFGLYQIGYAIVGLVIRSRLAKFKPDAPRLLFLYFAINAGAVLCIILQRLLYQKSNLLHC